VAHFEPLEIKAEPEDEGGNQFRLTFQEKDNLSLRIKTAHKLEFSVKAITKKIDLVLRRATFPLTPIEVLIAGQLVSPFTISGDTVKHGPIASGQILDTLEVRIFIEPRSKDYYKKYYRKAATNCSKKRKHDEGKEQDEEKEYDEEQEEDEEKEHICEEIIHLFQEHGKMMQLEDLKAVFRITKSIMRQ